VTTGRRGHAIAILYIEDSSWIRARAGEGISRQQPTLLVEQSTCLGRSAFRCRRADVRRCRA
jgi:hypothetical protein